MAHSLFTHVATYLLTQIRKLEVTAPSIHLRLSLVEENRVVYHQSAAGGAG